MTQVKYLDNTGLASVWSKVKGIVTPKADKVSGATAGHLAGLNSSGNLTDSGLPASNIAQKDGSYSGMTVGAAEDLVSAESVASEFTSRITGGSTAVGKGGTALVDRIKGRTLVWNQLVQNGNFPSMDGWAVATSNTASVSGNKLTITCGNENNNNNCAQQYISILGQHYYYLSFYVKVTTSLTFSESFIGYFGAPTQWLGRASYNDLIAGMRVSLIARAEEDHARLHVGVYGQYLPVSSTVEISDVKLIDLTLMFGSGSEPSTTAEFEALYPLPYYDYNTGTLVSNAATAIETVGWNQYDPATGKARVIGGKQYHVGGTYTSLSKDGATITPDASGLFTPDTSGEVTVVGGTSTDTIISLTDPSRNGTYEPYWRSRLELNIPTLTGKLNGTGNSVVIFPDGLRSAGSVYDEIVGNKAIKRVGSADLGTLVITYDTSFVPNTPVFYVQVPDRKNGSRNLMCVLYYVAGPSRAYLEGTNMAMASHNSSSAKPVDFTNSSYTDAESFKAAMSGVMLYYELATPEEYILDEAIPTAMRNDPYGTERRLQEDTAAIVTAPFRADITYSTNIKEAVQSLPQNYININSMQDFLAALGALMGGTWTMRQADGKFDFTFTPNPSNE